MSSQSDIEQSGWPLARADRRWTQLQLFVVLLVAAAATWCYIIGEYVGYYLNLKMGFAAMTAGSMIGMLLVTLAVVPAATRYGIDSIASAKPQFGNNGWLITVFLQYASIIGWNCLLLIFFGKSVAQLFVALGLTTAESSDMVVRVVAAIACVFVFLILLAGANGLEKVSTILFFFIVGIGLWMIYLLLTVKGADIATAKPSAASESLQWNYVTGIEIGIVSLLSWWPYIGAMVRQAPNAHNATLPAMLGMGLPVPLLSVVGLASILALQKSDPSAWFVELGGTTYGVIALLFVIAANLGTFLAFIGVFFAPLCGIQIVDYFLLRGQRINIRGVYQSGPGTPYEYWGGFNIVAILAMAAGFATYLYLLNPISYVSNSPYEYLTASLPTAVVGGLVYLIGTLAIVKPSGKGDY